MCSEEKPEIIIPFTYIYFELKHRQEHENLKKEDAFSPDRIQHM